jgi:cell division protein FtsQ
MRPSFRYALVFLCVAVVGVGALILFGHIERFLISDTRFTLAAPPEYGEESPSLRIEGLQHTARGRVLSVFTADFGRSVYLIPLPERRRALLAIDWVKEASIARIWPNRLRVRIAERRPVAFLQLPNADPTAPQFALIDEDGVILQPHGPANFTLPVLTGVRRDDSETLRRDRAHRLMRLVEDLGPLAERISEVDVTEPENLKVTVPLEDRAMVLILGNRHFQLRLQGFLNHHADIRKRLPEATMFDLRLEDRITAVGATPNA